MAAGFPRLFALLAVAPLLLGSIDRTVNLEQRLLAAHNRERAALDLPALEWDRKLSADAAAWARALSSTGTFEHSRDDPDDPDPQGENLWAGTAGAYSPEDMVGLWVDEKHNYRPGRIPNVSLTGDFEDVGHYTQVIWRATRKVGCALATGGREDVLVCRYSEGGNVLGERAI
ncbi:CAP domain-containing protein [Sphingomonas flavalba]|uniref:CAP domain-containing protein n=1 Tax=Sphingomonas flavalba TaxID=2559804 RepID=UPI0039DFD58D